MRTTISRKIKADDDSLVRQTRRYETRWPIMRRKQSACVPMTHVRFVGRQLLYSFALSFSLFLRHLFTPIGYLFFISPSNTGCALLFNVPLKMRKQMKDTTEYYSNRVVIKKIHELLNNVGLHRT